jgi:SAM-dependent methyltransferase
MKNTSHSDSKLKTIIRTSRNPRLNPSRLYDRYYHLKRLRDEMILILNEYFSNRDLTLVDVGCGNMPYRPLFECYVKRYIGVDLPQNKQAEYHILKNGGVDLPDKCADVVLSTQVLEHVTDPKVYLDECYRLLKPNGLLLLSTHGYWMYHPDPTDWWRWTCDGLRKIIEEANFRIIRWRGILGLAASSIQLLQDALMPKLPRSLRKIFGCVMQFVAGLIDKLHTTEEREKEACIFIALCVKK